MVVTGVRAGRSFLAAPMARRTRRRCECCSETCDAGLVAGGAFNRRRGGRLRHSPFRCRRCWCCNVMPAVLSQTHCVPLQRFFVNLMPKFERLRNAAAVMFQRVFRGYSARIVCRYALRYGYYSLVATVLTAIVSFTTGLGMRSLWTKCKLQLVSCSGLRNASPTSAW